MDVKKFFQEMYFHIWQGNDLSKIDDFYANDFEETVCVSDENKQPIELTMAYNDIVKQAKWQKNNYQNTTIDIKKIVAGVDNHISVNFYSSSIYKKTGELRHRCVCGIWRLNQENKIDRVWAVVTPYYPI
ncbi:MAG: hypothetical protein A3F10_05555 [Coxiella sp. RIFCSPHIGHO2_12_FULL_42_15]|nr:MAG: hypothetical protein A3F10_05555 [Coxiella sp. RIFCSPHIGHO2_12_FULL_42_15]